MSKRPAEDHENGGVSLKGGDRPGQDQLDDEVGEFEDEFEDEYESEDEILEAGVDGRPDAEREAEEKAGEQYLDFISSMTHFCGLWLIFTRSYGRGPADLHSWQK